MKKLFNKSERYTTVTDEHLPIAPELLGRELAPVWRRGVAMAIDAVLALLFVVLPWTVACGLTAVHLQAPSVIPFFSRLWDSDVPAEERGAGKEQVWKEVVELMARRRPDLLSSEALQTLREGRYESAEQILGEGSNLNVQLSEKSPSYFDRSTNTYHLHGDILFGPMLKVTGGVTGFLIYFTLLLFFLKGRTPGKWLLGLRVARLDGRRLSLWDAFGRAGGYSASLSMIGLGFVEAFWNPNRQTVHDRISGTVVLRWPRRGSLKDS